MTLNQPAIANSTHSRPKDTPTSHFQSWTWSKEHFCILRLTQGNLELTLPPYSLDKHQKLIDKVLHPPCLPHPWLKPGKHPAVKSFLLYTNTTHQRTIKALQTTKITKKKSSVSPPISFKQKCKDLKANNYLAFTRNDAESSESNSEVLTNRPLLHIQLWISWSVILLIFHFPEAMQHNFVLRPP